MFKPKTEKINLLSENYPKVVKDLESIFEGKTNVYIDFANVLGWQNKLCWHIDLKRLKQFLDSFDTVDSVKFYHGTFQGNAHSVQTIKDVRNYGYDVKTKPVKVIKLGINVSSIPINSPALLESFIAKPLLSKLNLETIEYLNQRLKELNEQGILYIEDLKCNFDVEIGRDILVDCDKNEVENFILWSGDSDFADPVKQLLKDNKQVTIFSTVRRVSTELSETGAKIFDIKKIKEFICWPRELTTIEEEPIPVKRQKDSRRSP